MLITTLKATVALTKSYSIENKKLIVSTYPSVSRFTSTEHLISTPQDLFQVVQTASEDKSCLLKGNVSRPLVNESRKGSTSPLEATEWLCLDLDGIPSLTAPEAFLALLPKPFSTTSYVVQYSSSQGIKDSHLHCHLFMLLAAPVLPATLKSWLQHLNLTSFADALHLRKNNNALAWVVDDTTCQNDKLLYMAAPEIGPGVKCSFTDERISLVKKKNAKLTFDFAVDEIALKNLKFAKINELRTKAGHPAFRKNSLKFIEGAEVQMGASPCQVTGIKTERDFVYLNLNGGNSWGYFHPVDKPDILFNFKGEPNYLTHAILPEYWAPIQAERDRIKAEKKQERLEQNEKLIQIREAKKEALKELVEVRKTNVEIRALNTQTKEEKKEASLFQAINSPVAKDGYRYFAAISIQSKMLFYGRYNPTTKDLVAHETSRGDLIHHFFMEYNQPLPAFYPHWNITFDFGNDTLIDIDNHFLNLYKPTEYMLQTPVPSSLGMPPYIRSILFHATGSDQESFDRFVNWLAYIIQFKKKSGIAWVLHGTEGTGKGLFFDKVLKPIIGERYVHTTLIDTLADDQFNAFLESNIFCLINEADLTDFLSKSKLNAKMKSYITDNYTQIRKMGVSSYMAPSFSNYLVFSNMPMSATVSMRDRRWSIAKFQEEPFTRPTDKEIAQIETELPLFTNFLKTYEVNIQDAVTPLLNEERTQMQELSLSTPQEFAHKIKTGDFEYFVENRPDFFRHPSVDLEEAGRLLPTYDEVLDFIVENQHYISRDHLQVLYHHVLDKPYTSPARWTRHLRFLGLKIKPVGFKNFKFQGLNNIPWNVSSETLILLQQKRDVTQLRPSMRASEAKAQNPTRSSRAANNTPGRFRKDH